MAREPQPRTSGLSVEEADAKGLVRNSLLDSAANWDSKGKQQLRKGYLQTIQAAEDYVTTGPVGQNVAALMRWYDLSVYQNFLFIPEQENLLDGGFILNLPLPETGMTSTWMVEGQVTFSATDSGDVSIMTTLPPDDIAFQATLFNESDSSFVFVSGDSGVLTLPFSAGSSDRILKYQLFITQEFGSSVYVNFSVDTPAQGVLVKPGSYIKSTLDNVTLMPL